MGGNSFRVLLVECGWVRSSPSVVANPIVRGSGVVHCPGGLGAKAPVVAAPTFWSWQLIEATMSTIAGTGHGCICCNAWRVVFLVDA